MTKTKRQESACRNRDFLELGVFVHGHVYLVVNNSNGQGMCKTTHRLILNARPYPASLYGDAACACCQ
jgi:hypothetical protein